MKKSKLFKILGIAILLITFLCACQVGDENGTEYAEYEYLKDLEENRYYVRHKNNKCEEIYFGEATFSEGDVVSGASDDRIFWFKGDFKKIPTLYKGESLIYCTSEELFESFTFERFEYYGYSIGLCGLTETTSGRYSISTDPEEKNTYPEGDTDEILLLKNDTVILDKLGGVSIRAPKEGSDDIENSKITRSGTIKGLKKGNVYKAEIYEGTKKNTYKFKADVVIMASMDVTESVDYEFESEKIINIKIPEEFNSGYYMINGLGLFRYVNAEKYDKNTDFNIPNVIEENENIDSDDIYTEEFQPEGNEDDEETEEDIRTSYFNINEAGEKTVTAKITNAANIAKISAYIVDPAGVCYDMKREGETFKVTFDTTITGEFTFKIENLGDATITVHIE